MSKIHVVPLTLKQGKEYVEKHHRHHKAPVGHKFSVGISDGESLRGVAIVGRPVARNADDGLTLEVTRCCTDGVKNGCSMLYGTARRLAKTLGYKKIITYTLESESGSSLRASGWECAGPSAGGSWSRPSRGRDDKHPLCKKIKWQSSWE